MYRAARMPFASARLTPGGEIGSCTPHITSVGTPVSSPRRGAALYFRIAASCFPTTGGESARSCPNSGARPVAISSTFTPTSEAAGITSRRNAAHPARADLRAHPKPHHPQRERGSRAPVGERAEQRQAPHPRPRFQRQPQRDQPAERVPDDVRGFDLLRVEDGERVVGHLLDGEYATERLTAGHPAVVERDAPEPRRERVGLRLPTAAVNADTLNEKHRRTVAVQVVGEFAAAMLNGACFVVRFAHFDSVSGAVGVDTARPVSRKSATSRSVGVRIRRDLSRAPTTPALTAWLRASKRWTGFCGGLPEEYDMTRARLWPLVAWGWLWSLAALEPATNAGWSLLWQLLLYPSGFLVGILWIQRSPFHPDVPPLGERSACGCWCPPP